MYEVEMVIKESIPTQWGLNSLHAVRNIGLNRIIGLQVGMGGGIPCFGVGRVCERKNSIGLPTLGLFPLFSFGQMRGLGQRKEGFFYLEPFNSLSCWFRNFKSWSWQCGVMVMITWSHRTHMVAQLPVTSGPGDWTFI